MKQQPKHYSGGGVSPLDCFREGLMEEDFFIGFCKGNVIKYVVRAGKKDGESALSDYCKARDYLDELIELEKKP